MSSVLTMMPADPHLSGRGGRGFPVVLSYMRVMGEGV